MLDHYQRRDGAVIQPEQRKADQLLTDHGRHESPGGRSPGATERILVGACGVIWLAALAMGVTATVAFVRLANGEAGGGEQRSSWLLYTIIVVSALIIAGAIPLLLRARRGAVAQSLPAESRTPLVQQPRRPIRPPDASTEKIRVFGVDPDAQRRIETSREVVAVPSAVLDRLLLRGTVALLGTMGLAMIAVSAGSYLLASGRDDSAWIALGVAGVVTVAMPALVSFLQRQLAEAVEAVEAVEGASA